MGAFLEGLLSMIVGGFLIGVFIASGIAGAIVVAIVLACVWCSVKSWFDERKR